jgi:aspartate/methionine/tyrosine aminotransferase
VIISFPHSPTGAQIDSETLSEIVRLCDRRGIRLFSDEVYRFLERPPFESVAPAAALHPRAVSLGVMSKSFALAGLRVGWIATRDRELLHRIAELKDYTTICGSAPSEILALIALRSRDAVLARSRAIVDANLPVLENFMRRHEEHLTWVPPRAASVCFPRFRGNVDADRAAEQLIARTGVLILPGSRFDYDRAHFRIGFGRRDMADALALIDPLIPELATAPL